MPGSLVYREQGASGVSLALLHDLAIALCHNTIYCTDYYDNHNIGDMDHEYSILNHDRGQVLLWIGSAIALGAALYARYIGLIQLTVGVVHPSLSGVIPATLDFGTAWGFIYWLFNRWGWRIPLVRHCLDLPSIAGRWQVAGSTEGPVEALEGAAPRPWQGEVTIVQTWTRIYITLKTSQSQSRSTSAAVQSLPDGTVRLMYSYGNDPTMSAASRDGLKRHTGYCELVFKPKQKQAEGWYFNNLGRVTFGSMNLSQSLAQGEAS